MSLIKQLWLAIITVLLLAFGGSLLVAMTSSRAYLEQEIRIKNADNAYALALAMTQLPKDEVTLELLVSAQFDTGHYQEIKLTEFSGDVVIRRNASEAAPLVPRWFSSLVAFDVPPGEAVVQDGWRQYGTVTLRSQHDYAYLSLWQGTLRLAGWFTAAGLISLFIAYAIVRRIRAPLRIVVRQANDISQRRFTISPLPRTRELREVSDAMNQLSASVRQMLERESEQIDRLRRQLLHDSVTGAMTRDAFLDRLSFQLAQEDGTSYGSMALVRATDLASINEQHGYPYTNLLLQDLSQRLQAIADAHGNAYVGRLNGSDFSLLLCGDVDQDWALERLDDNLRTLTAQHAPLLHLPAAFTHYEFGDQRADLLSNLDGALSLAESGDGHGIEICSDASRESLYQSRVEWRGALLNAMDSGIMLGQYPVINNNREVLHFEAPVRLNLNHQWRQASAFLPWISRLRLQDTLDLKVLDEALKIIRRHQQPLGINLSHESATNPNLVLAMQQRLSNNVDAATRLWIEVPESIARADIQAFRYLCRALRPFGCRVGIEHVGAAFRQLGDLQDLGLSYIKLDATLTRNVSQKPEQQTILRGMATLCHSLAILAIAEGVEDEQDIDILFELGLDGATGPAVTAESGM